MTAKQHELPGWFPYALVASGLVALAAGIKSNWGRGSKSTVKQAGVLQDWLPSKRWFFWYVLPPNATAYGARGPENLTDQEAFQLEFETKSATLGTQIYRFVWIPSQGSWIYDTRNDPDLLASREIRDERGNVVG